MIKRLFIPVLLMVILLGLSSCSAPAEQNSQLIRVACIGDSITYGIMVEDRDMNSYPAQLQALLGNNYQVKNYGVNGAAMLKNADLPYWHQPPFKTSSEFNPDIVLIMLGTNDSKKENWTDIESYLTCYLEMIAHYQALPAQPTIYILTPPSAYNMDGNSHLLSFGMQLEAIQEMAAGLKTMSVAEHLPVIDIYTATADREYFTHDGIHLNKEGARAIAHTVYDQLTKPLSP